MKNNIILSLIFCLFIVSSSSAQTKGKLYSVTTIEQFFEVLGPNRTIELASEFFFLPKEMDKGLVLNDYEGLTIMGYDEKTVRFVTPAADVPVMTFNNCKNITLKNIELGHAPEHATTCDGHVVSFYNCKDIKINDCFLFGSGFLGISATKVKGLECTNTIIRGCTGRILTLSECEKVNFKDCVFTDNVGTSDMVSITKSKKVTFDQCEISLNRMKYVEVNDMMTGSSIFAVSDSKKIIAKACSIVGNSTPFLFKTASGMELEDCNIHSNTIHVKDVKMKG